MPRYSIDWSEFLKNESGKESSDRLLLLLSFPFATVLAIKIGTTEALGVYLAAYGALAANNKWANRHVVSNDSKEILVGDSSGANNVASEPLASESKPARRGKKSTN
jgi:hypothetical protein